MIAVHFGAGNIGRGFIGELLYKSNYKVVFIDVNERLIEAINRDRKYYVTLADNKSDKIVVKNISGVNSLIDPDKVRESIINAEIITTAIGKNNFPNIAPLLSKGLLGRIQVNKRPINIIACENVINGSSELELEVYQHLSKEESSLVRKYVRFVNTTIDRIVPNQNHGNLLDTTVEPYFEWIVDKKTMIGEIPEIKGVTFVDELTPYIERKLFTVNTGHATAAYIGKYYGYATISEAMNDDKIKSEILHVLRETGAVLIKKYNFDSQEHEAYIQKIIERFSNPMIVDEVVRVGRDPIRKLGPNDRFTLPLKLYKQMVGEQPIHLALAIAYVLLYDVEFDDESKQIQAMIKKSQVAKTIEQITGLSEYNSLNKLITSEYTRLKNFN